MKKFLLLFIVFAAAGVVFTACSPEKKDRLSADTAAVSIDPVNPDTMSVGETVQFVVLVRNNGVDVNRGADWSVEPESLGSCSPKSGKTTMFTASTAGSGKITADVGGIKKQVDITVQ